MDKTTTFSKKIENYWYHYKWHTIVGAAALILIALFAKDLFGREKYDLKILMTTQEPVSEELVTQMREQLDKYAVDLNGDGTANIDLMFIDSPNEVEQQVDPQLQMAAQMKMMSEFTVADAMMIITDDVVFENFYHENTFTDLVKKYPELELVDNGGHDFAKIPLNKFPAFESMNLGELGDNLKLVIRSDENIALFKKEKMTQNLDHSKTFLDRLVKDEQTVQ